MRTTLLALLSIASGIAATLWLQLPTRVPAVAQSGGIATLNTGDKEGFARADGPWHFVFPDDHGAHPRYQTESWYFTGNLTTKEERRFGFQLTFFRLALSPDPPRSTSAWATNQVYRAHFALTDVASARFHNAERFSRAALGLSGALNSPVRIWLDNWFVEVPANGDTATRLHLRASESDVGMDLQLVNVKPMVLPDEDGVFGDSAGPNAFHFYLLTRMRSQGTLQIGADIYEVEGFASLDRAWGEIPVSQGQIAINRFVLRLDDGREIMILQLRRRDGSAAPINTGVLVKDDGSVRTLGRLDLAVDVQKEWVSPRDGSRYPGGWRIRLPTEELELDVVPEVDDQELHHTLRYWGGAVRMNGKQKGNPLTGNGFVELTGYAEGT